MYCSLAYFAQTSEPAQVSTKVWTPNGAAHHLDTTSRTLRITLNDAHLSGNFAPNFADRNFITQGLMKFLR
jgi:hypothetical protein